MRVLVRLVMPVILAALPAAAPRGQNLRVGEWRALATPRNGWDQPNTSWIEVAAPNGRTLRAVVARPRAGADTPAPIVIVLHTAGGFGPPARRLTNDLADAGFLAVAGCWFKSWFDPPGYPATDPAVASARLIECPDAPAYDGWNPSKAATVMALVAAARTLPGADARHVALMGSSAGASVSVVVASLGLDVQAIVADSADYGRASRTSTLLMDRAKDLSVPILILHGTADPDTKFQEAQKFETALKRAGKTYTTQYVDGGIHVLLSPARPYYPEQMAAAIGFLKRALR